MTPCTTTAWQALHLLREAGLVVELDPVTLDEVRDHLRRLSACLQLGQTPPHGPRARYGWTDAGLEWAASIGLLESPPAAQGESA